MSDKTSTCFLPPFDQVCTDRLLTLARYLERLKDRPSFDMTIFYRGENRSIAIGLPVPECGFAGCAIGHMPQVWPDHIEACTGQFKLHDAPISGYTLAALWFGLSTDEVSALFGGSYLTRNFYRSCIGWSKRTKLDSPAPSTVARDIRDFLKWRNAR